MLLYTTNGYSAPPLVTTSPPAAPLGQIGVMGQPDTEVVAGGADDSLGNGLRTGGRFTVGSWFDPRRRVGVQGEIFVLGDGNGRIFESQPSDGVIARPYTDIGLDPAGVPAAEVVNLDGLSRGAMTIDASTRVFSAAPSLRLNQATLGYRYFRFDETLRISESFEPDNGLFPDGTNYAFTDVYRTKNRFHGFDVGFDMQRQLNRLTLGAIGKVALGQMTRTVDLRGNSSVLVPGAVDSQFNTGFYNTVGKTGVSTDRKLAAIPEFGLRMGYLVGPNLRLTVGYNVLYLGGLARPGSQVDQAVDPALLLANAAATERVRDTTYEDVWLHGTSIGATFSY